MGNKDLHRELCEIGAKWLKRPESQKGHACHISIIEAACYGENPDVIGYRHGNPKTYDAGTDKEYQSDYHVGTTLIEVKTSRSDFLVDKKKPHRLNPATGMGKWRYYLCPEGVIKVEDLPPKWGLLYVNKRGHIKVMHGALFGRPDQMRESVHPTTGKVDSYLKRSEKWQNFKDFAFNERHIQNEMNLLTMALVRVDGSEGLLYEQRRANALSMQVQQLQIDLTGVQKQLNSYTAADTFDRFKQKMDAIAKTQKD